MNLGRKLFLGFIGATLLGITLFGYITYQATRYTQIDALTDSTIVASRHLAVLLVDKDPAQSRILLNTSDNQTFYTILTQPNGNLVYNSLDEIDHSQLASRILSSNKQHGYYKTENNYFIWAKQPVAGSELLLYLIHRHKKFDFFDFMNTSGLPILIASIFLVLLAAFGALILNTLYRRLDSQRQELEYQTLHDSLTGLPNRTFLVEKTEQCLKKNLPDNHCVALIVIDINRFKEINDTLGHYTGDELLQMIANRLREVIRDDDILARIVSNEFALLLDSTSQASALAAAARIQTAMNEGYEIEGNEFYLGASIGVALYPEHAMDAINLIRHGEMAMYAAKHIGIGTVIFDETHKTSTLEQLKLVNDLRTDLENRNIQLFFQPKIDLNSEQVVSLEALARWEHPDHGHIAASRFIHIAENTGLINPLTYWVMDYALHSSQKLQERGIYLNMAINLSVWNLQDSNIVQHLEDLLKQYQVDASSLTLEITETAMMVNQKRALHTLHQLHKIGIKLSIDDFGTGYSSMAYLKKLPLSEVKIDKSFIKLMHKQPDDSTMVRAIIDLAHDLGLSVVGEGVENRQIADMLRELGCDQVQGSYYADAIPFDELIDWLDRRAQKA